MRKGQVFFGGKGLHAPQLITNDYLKMSLIIAIVILAPGYFATAKLTDSIEAVVLIPFPHAILSETQAGRAMIAGHHRLRKRAFCVVAFPCGNAAPHHSTDTQPQPRSVGINRGVIHVRITASIAAMYGVGVHIVSCISHLVLANRLLSLLRLV